MKFFLFSLMLFSLSLQGAFSEIYVKELAQGVDVSIKVLEEPTSFKLELKTFIPVFSENLIDANLNIPEDGLALHTQFVQKIFKSSVPVYVSGRNVNAHKDHMFFTVSGLDFIKKEYITIDQRVFVQSESSLSYFILIKTFFIDSFGPCRSRDDKGVLIPQKEQTKLYVESLLKIFLQGGFQSEEQG